MTKLIERWVAFGLLLGVVGVSTAAAPHAELLLEQVSANKKIEKDTKFRIDPDTGKPLFEIKPNFLKGSPVHERMTAMSVTLSKIHGRPYHTRYDLPYIQGVFWNDDPERLLCPWCSYFHINKWGPIWASRFLEAKAKATKVDAQVHFTSGNSLLARSHFGDLQFLHAMTGRSGVPASVTLEKILDWAEFTYKIASGTIRPDAPIKDIKQAAILKLFVNDPAILEGTVADLFHNGAVRRVALGSLLHMMQDSYSQSHVNRFDQTSPQRRFCRGAIRGFHAYVGQDGEKHAAADLWPEGIAESASSRAPFCDPVSAGARLLSFADPLTAASWPEVEKFLRETVFSLDDRAALSNAGRAFESDQ